MAGAHLWYFQSNVVGGRICKGLQAVERSQQPASDPIVMQFAGVCTGTERKKYIPHLGSY